jgi:predicted glutamine amidotransferase
VCRLYAMRASEPTKVECTLVHAQNALLVQSRADLQGTAHADGWGVCTYDAARPDLVRQAWAAYHGEHFRRTAARIHSPTVLAHVRRATVGGAAIENTHPFTHGRWAFAHNGTVPSFAAVRPRLLAVTSPEHRAAITGSTDSEHIFHMLLSLREQRPRQPLADLVASATALILGWCHHIDPAAPVGLNLLLTDGARLVGTRWGRTLFAVERHGVRDCEVCGFPHVRHQPAHDYRAVAVASEPITTQEVWSEVPDRSVFEIDPGWGLSVGPIGETSTSMEAV